MRVDDEYQGRPKWVGAIQDPSTLQYDPANYTLSSTNFASARGGMIFGDWQIEAFCDNLTDSHTITNYEWSINSQVANTSRLQRDFTFRPRTYGLTLALPQQMTYRGARRMDATQHRRARLAQRPAARARAAESAASLNRHTNPPPDGCTRFRAMLLSGESSYLTI